MIRRAKRRSKPPNRVVGVMVRLRPQEHSRIARHAEETGLSMSAWIRTVLLQSVRISERRDAEQKEGHRTSAAR